MAGNVVGLGFEIISKVWAKKTRHVQKLAIIKNPQFLSNPYETWWKNHLMRQSFSPSFIRIGQKLWFFYWSQLLDVSVFFLLRLYIISVAFMEPTLRMPLRSKILLFRYKSFVIFFNRGTCSVTCTYTVLEVKYQSHSYRVGRVRHH